MLVGLDDGAFRHSVESWLRSQLGGEVEVTGLRKAPAGQSSGTVLFEAKRTNGRIHPLVLRLQPGEGHIFLDPDVIREGRVLMGLADADADGVAVPAVIGLEPDSAVLGAPFFVMEQVAGRVPPGRPSFHQSGWVHDLAPDLVTRLWESAIATVAAVHRTSWPDTHHFLAEGGPADDVLDLRMRWMSDWYAWTTKGRRYPITDAGMSYLLSRQAEVTQRIDSPVLVWGDARVGNMIFDETGSVAAALDWEVATIGPAEIDLAHWLFFDEFLTKASGVERLEGWPDRRTTIERYEEISGRELRELEYFDVMQLVFMATTLIRQSDRRVALGLSPAGSRMGHDNSVTQMLARRLGLAVPGLSPDYLAHRGVKPPT